MPLLGLLAFPSLGQTTDAGLPMQGVTEANPAFIIQSSADSVCPGDPVTLEVDVQEDGLVGTTTGGNSQNGVMFDVTAAYGATITGFELYLNSTSSTVAVYYKTGTHVGSETTPGNWTFLDSVQNVPSGSPVRPNLQLSQPILPGQTLAFYVTTTNGNMNYTNGTSVGNTLSSDSYLTIKEGVGKSYPFASTFSPRNFNGTIFYEKGVSSVMWNQGGNTPQITVNPSKSFSYQAEVEFTDNSISREHVDILVDDPQVTLIATPPQVTPGQSTVLSADVQYHTGVFGGPDGTNSQNGAMFDVSATVPIVLKGFTVNPRDTCDIEIFYKTGSFVGSETNANAWTSLGSLQNVPGGHSVELNLPINMSIAAGQTIGFYITTTTTGDYLNYTNGSLTPGAPYINTPYLSISEGVGKSYPFGSTFTPRRLNMIVHYSVDNPTQSAFQWSTGSSSGSVQVSPASSSWYSLATTLGGCTSNDSIWVPITGVGLDEWEDLISFNVFPNPTHDQVQIELELETETTLTLSLTNTLGQSVILRSLKGKSIRENLNLSTFSPGVYILSISSSDGNLIKRLVRE